MDEQLCGVCGEEGKKNTLDKDADVLIICENCLKSDRLLPLLDSVLYRKAQIST